MHWSWTNYYFNDYKTWLKPVYEHVYVALDTRYTYIRQLVNFGQGSEKSKDTALIGSCYQFESIMYLHVL